MVSIAYLGNIVDVWERFDQENLHIDLGSDQTSLHNPWAGGYYPIGHTFEESNELMATQPEKFKEEVQKHCVDMPQQLINIPLKAPISLIMEMPFTRSLKSRSRCDGNKQGRF